ncbi:MULTISPECIES: hypothetical protein [unclassified Nocardiopsis]|uniref:hypothetical protein n=1 Tax=Nocardiopsis TaxID=2013 RepID=UPI00387B5429
MEHLLTARAEKAGAEPRTGAQDTTPVVLLVQASGDTGQLRTLTYDLTGEEVREWGLDVVRILREATQSGADWVWVVDGDGDPVGMRASDIVFWAITELNDEGDASGESEEE